MVIRWLWPDAVRLERWVYLVHDIKGGAAAFGPWVFLSLGLFYKLTREELHAVVVHERGHRWHWYRAFGFCPGLVHDQEFAADDHAKKLGYGKHLASALQKLDPDDRSSGKIYPLTSERIRRLLA